MVRKNQAICEYQFHFFSSANILPQFECADKRPYYFVQKFEHYQYASTFCFGESKLGTANDMSRINNFYRLALFAKTEMDTSHLNAVICFQTIGKIPKFFHYVWRRSSQLLTYFYRFVNHILYHDKEIKHVGLCRIGHDCIAIQQAKQYVHFGIPR